MNDCIDIQAELRRHNLLVPLLQRRIIAEATSSEILTDDELLEAREQFLRKNNINNDDLLNDFLVKNGWDDQDLNWNISLPLRIQKHCTKNYKHKAEAYFLKRKSQLDQVIYSLLRVKDYYLAQELYWRIKTGESNFGDLAASFAEGPERKTKGIIGPVPMSQAHPVLAEALRTTKPGVLMTPIKIGEWSIVARLEEYNPATFNEALAAKLSQELFDQWINTEVASKMESSVGTMLIQAANDQADD